MTASDTNRIGNSVQTPCQGTGRRGSYGRIGPCRSRSARENQVPTLAIASTRITAPNNGSEGSGAMGSRYFLSIRSAVAT